MIKINNLTKKYKDKLVLDKVNLQIPSNKISFFVGKNGSGKTTLIDILAGLNKINHGSIQIDNKDARIPYSKSLRKKIFSLPVENISVEYLTAKENLLYYSELFKLKLSDRKIKDILQSYNLFEETDFSVTFSTGMKKRLDLAILDMIAPEIILLDEPSLGLDVYHVDFLRKQILNYKKLGKTVIVTSHDMALSEKIADMIYLFSEKKIIAYNAKDVNSEEIVLESYKDHD